METGSTRVYVSPRSGGGWELRETPAGASLSRTATRRTAVVRAMVMLESARGGQVLVLEPDGSVESRYVVEPSRAPWWYARPGKTRWLLLLIVGAEVSLRAVSHGTGPFELALTVGLVALLVAALVMVLGSRARDRARNTDGRSE